MTSRLLCVSAALILGCNPLPDADNFPDREGREGQLLASEEEVCEALQECDLWIDEQSCQENLLTTETCIQITGYLSCVVPCLEEGSCRAFAACESDCWASECELDFDPLGNEPFGRAPARTPETGAPSASR